MKAKINKEMITIIISLAIIFVFIVIDSLNTQPMTDKYANFMANLRNIFIILLPLVCIALVWFEKKIGYYLSFILGVFVLFMNSIVIYTYLFTELYDCFGNECTTYQLFLIPRTTILIFFSILILILSTKAYTKSKF